MYVRYFPLLLFVFSSPAVAQTASSAPDSAIDADIQVLADLLTDGIPNLLAPESMAKSYRLPSGIPAPDAKAKVPTGIRYSDGPLNYEIGTSVTANKTTTAIIPQIPNPIVIGGAAGGSGEIKGQIRYSDGAWELYGTEKIGVTQADGSTPSAHDSLTLGSTYRLPDWLAGGKVGASLELAASNERKTRLEYRQKFGPAEGFVAAEQTFVPNPPDEKLPVQSVRAGVTRKF